MTKSAFQSLMLSIQFKPGIVMIEIFRLPVIVGVTTFTLRYSIGIELLKMNIIMTVGAILIFPFELLIYVISIFFRKMAFPAGHRPMSSEKFKIRRIMVE